MCNERRAVQARDRQGLITAIGILLGFAWNFAIKYSTTPGEWQTRDLPVIILLSIGFLFQVISLFLALLPLDQSEAQYKVTVHLFVIGGVLSSLAGVVIGIATPSNPVSHGFWHRITSCILGAPN